MKKIFAIGLVGIVAGTGAADAGFWDRLGFGKSSEPKTLEEACSTSEITKVCPDMILGSQTLMGCLSENISSLSTKCANYVKKYVSEKANEIVSDVTGTVGEATDEVATAKAEGTTAVQEIKDAAKQTGDDLKATGNAIKEIFQ